MPHCKRILKYYFENRIILPRLLISCTVVAMNLMVYVICFGSTLPINNQRQSETKFDEDHQPKWWDNSIGMSDVILPGFSPLDVNGTQVRLGASRSYEWKMSYLPTQLVTKGGWVTGPLDLVLQYNMSSVVLKPETVVVREATPTHVTIVAKGRTKGLEITSETRIEYDGLAMVSIKLIPIKPIEVEGFYLRINVKKTRAIQVLAFDANTVRKRIKNIILSLPYKGNFLNAVGFPDGERSFWWFADNAEGWVWNSDSVTELNSKLDTIAFRQKLIGSHFEITKPMEFKFNFLVTPIKELGGGWRKNRIARRITKEEAKYAKYQLWWVNAFAHQDLPYTSYPNGAKNQLPKRDIEAYLGLKKNRELINRYRMLGMERLPYFSAHVLSTLDPALQKYRSIWEVDPPYVMPPGSDLPYTAKLEKPWLSHRARSYTNYLVYRFDKLINEFGFHGIYFDQGGVIQSKNPMHGAWRDSNGILRASMDILALREFFKRLSTLFYLKNKNSLIYVHNSMVPIIPAYTFVSSMVQGEEYVQTLKDLDYISSAPLYLIRSLYSPNQYGVVTTWLSELWSPRINGVKELWVEKDTWLNSTRYLKAYRNFIALTLLHDIPNLSFAPLRVKEKIYKVLDSFGYTKADFNGYWNNQIETTNSDNFIISYYKNKLRDKALVIVVNIGDTNEETVDIINLSKSLAMSNNDLVYRVHPNYKFQDVVDDKIHAMVPKKDFRFIEIVSIN